MLKSAAKRGLGLEERAPAVTVTAAAARREGSPRGSLRHGDRIMAPANPPGIPNLSRG